MLGLGFDIGDRPLRVLCIGAHCDDIEIGCGATLATLARGEAEAVVDWVILSGTEQRQGESRAAMRALLGDAARGQLLFGDFEDGRFPAEYGRLKDFFEELKSLEVPDLILTHERDDRHQDHRICNEMVWSTFRDQVVLEFEIPKWDGGLGNPSVYVPVTREAAGLKVDALLSCHGSQRHRDWFTRSTFESLMRLRGIECRATAGLAEAFHARKLVLAPLAGTASTPSGGGA